MARNRSERWVLLFLVLLLETIVTLVHGGMYNEFVTELTPSNFDKEVINSVETWVIKFYAPWCGHCRSSAPSFSKAAKRLHGVVRLGVVDCDAHGELAQRFGVQGFPTFKTFSGEGKRARRPSDYNGDRSASAISSHARFIQPSFVARVMPNGVESFFKDLPRLPHVLLFTDKTQTSGLYKGMSARYHKRIAFGEARVKDGRDTAEKYGVTSFPTLMVFPPGDGALEKAKKYSGEMNPNSLIAYFDILAKDGADAAGEGSSSAAGDESETSKKRFAQPKAYSGEVESVRSLDEYVAKCGARADGRLCVLGLLPGGVEHSLKTAIAETAKAYLYDNIAFALIDTAEAGGKQFAQTFGDVPFVAVRSRKAKFSAMSTDGIPDISAVRAFVDRVVGGEVRYAKLGDLPEWASTSASEETATGNNSTHEQGEDDGMCREPPKEGGSCSSGASAGAEEKTEL